MRVLFLVTDPSLGPDVPFGDAIRVRLLIEALEREGVEVDVRWAGGAGVPGRFGPPPERRAPDWLRGLARDGRSLVRAAAFARTVLARRGPAPDLVFEFAAYLAPVGRLVARRLGVPYAVEVEGPLADLRYEAGGALLRPLGDVLERDRLRHAALVVTVSHPLAAHLVEQGAAAGRVDVLPNVADVGRFRPDPAARARTRAELGLGDEMVVGFHGVFSPWYRIDLLVEAVVEAGRLAAPGAPALSLLLVGDGVERQRVERRVAELGVGDRVRITGFVPHDEVPRLVDVFDVAVIPDHVWWTSPLKLFEYGAMGKAVVAPRVESIARVAGDDEVLLVEHASAAALASGIRLLADDPARRAALGEGWAARVRRDYAAETLARTFRASLERACARGRP